MQTDDEQELDDTLPGTSRSSFSHSLDVDAEIAVLLQTLRLEHNREQPVTDVDDEALKRVHEKIQAVIKMEVDPERRRRFKKASGSANRIREELYNLRRNFPQPIPAQSYCERIQPTLQDVVSCSFQEEYRKVAIVLGVVDSLAELLILDVIVHKTTPRFQQLKSIRKLIANALTNLTFGHGPSKKRLCSYPDFITTVVALFNEAKTLVQVYAGLIRNLSWMADSEMTIALNPCVSALAAAAVEAGGAGDESCVRAILCALWNLASHSTESKKAICDQPGCLRLLANVLISGSNSSYPIESIESASGILKYVSQYLTNHSDHSDLRPHLVKALVLHLSSSSFTALSNVLGAIGNLIAKDPHVQNEILSDHTVMRQLNSLRDSTREDVSSLVKTVLHHLNQTSTLRKPYHNHMSASLGVPSFSPRDRILNRAVIASPGNPSPMAMPQFASPAVYDQQRCSSLPRHFARGGFTGPPNGQMHHPQQFRPQQFGPMSAFHPHPVEQNYSGQDTLPQEDEYDDLSIKCDKSCASRRSLESELPSGWNSVPESVNTTANLSPVSPSDLPDSPTHFAQEREQERLEQEAANLREIGLLPQLPLTVNVPKGFNSNGSDLSRNGGSDAATAVVDDYPTPTFPPYGGNHLGRQMNGRQSENDYATLDVTAHTFLQMSIEAALPPATPRTSKRQKSPLDATGDQLLAETIQSAMPQKIRGTRMQGSEKLLQDCIHSAMPSPSTTSTLPKNAKGGRSQQVTSTDRHETHGHHFSEQLGTSSVLFSTEEESIRDATRLFQQDTDSENSDDDFDSERKNDVDMSLPLDCMEDEEVTIDCSTLTRGRPDSRSNILKPSRLPKPTYRPGASSRVKPPVKQKPQTQAVITPYNYQKPKESTTKTKSPETKSVVHSGANTMLVTTV